MHHIEERSAMETEYMLMKLPSNLRDELGVELGYCTGHSEQDSTRYSLLHKVVPRAQPLSYV